MNKIPKLHIFLIIYIFLCALVFLITGKTLSIWMIWNVFLAWLPLFFSHFITKYKNQKLTKIFFGVCFLFFLPNAFYVMTDLIHTNTYNFYNANYEISATYYTDNFDSWLMLFLIFIGVILSWTFGLKAIYKLQTLLPQNQIQNKKQNPTTNPKSRTIILYAILSFLCALGIWIGRFLRFNSWDIFNPLNLFPAILQNINFFTFQFISVFALMIFTSLIIFQPKIKTP
ncbi:MAG: DUF1361 domain-containing protein [Candidatus Nomurabacteria bacterium]|nr:DUF1361 domain-containing protein [Candidatus Nomurabacteria bacterium]